MDDSALTVLVLCATVLLRVMLVAGVAWLLIPRRARCPHCGETMDRLMVPRLVRALRLEHRWCLACGWEGITKSELPAGAPAGTRTTPIAPLGVVLLMVIQGCAAGQDEVDALFSEGATWIDLTYPFNDRTIYWPTAESFELESVAAGVTPDGYYYAANNFRGAEHGGTHLDAPVHFAEGQHTADQIPLTQLIGPAVVIDVSAKASANVDYLVSVQDLEAFESRHGRIPEGAIVLFRTGWGDRWPDRKAFLGTDILGEAAVPELHFPGVDSAAARWLATERAVDAVGIDTPSIDFGQSATFDAHRILFAADIPAFENVANLVTMPEIGAYVIGLPMKIEGGSGGPMRIVGVIPPSLAVPQAEFSETHHDY